MKNNFLSINKNQPKQDLPIEYLIFKLK